TVLALFIAPLFAPGAIKDWAKETHSLTNLLLNKERPVLYETSFNMIKHHPFVGVGVNTYVLNYQKYKLHDTSPETANTRWYAHNSYLQMACEIGITGLAVFFWLLFLLFSRWWRFYRKSKDNFLALCSLGMVMGLAAFLVHGLTETNLYYPKIAVLFWFQAALLMGVLCRRLSQ
ncbi:MAG: O-antigen ligase family protein, partial [Candidatus Omnitrophica bacterium]|nr:O-antigen ligase family protein [Candidatus Omnitrophota bacterium]